ncbi:glycoside hydrolase family 3 protein [Shewanella sp. WXL01]|uniref:glycoside hydrolase family 3 protein n=1 Tax=Shewanella sp. WXL01 TaxID=2709721 RepID=UPI0014386723|nr:exo 1,3/1,4-beta-D-glucan glucohydrolase [Shewanella sp. WXL01]NKF51686.1 glycoside hydrolase family 3 protein [Shewanella sp. WXL01]
MLNKSSKPAFVLSALAMSLALTACMQSSDDAKSSGETVTTTAAENALSSQVHLTKAIADNADASYPEHDINIWPKLPVPIAVDAELEARVANILSQMTLEQKVAQMMQPEIRDITVEDMRRYGFGSYLNGGGSFPFSNKQSTPQDWIQLAEDMYQASIDDSLDGSNIPTMWGTDAVHGHNNVIGATLFPHNIGLGAANNPELIKQIAAVTAKEVMVTGIDWVFAPTVAVVQDDRWGRTYEGYSEDPRIVREYSHAIVEGLQGAVDGDFLTDKHVISTVKHFLGDGGTIKGIDQGNNIASEQTLFDVHAQGYVGGLAAGAQTVMASFNSWHGVKNHGSKYLLTDVLKDRFGFDGLVVGDWNGHGQILGCSNESCPEAANAGLDVYMVPTSAWKPLLENTIAQVKSGEISQARIDDAVSRILRVKLRAGLFEKPSPANRPLSGKTELIGHAEHREVARQAVQQSLVLLKNNQNILPLATDINVLVAGDAADNIGKQSGGWTITWQGTDNQNSDFPGATSIYQGIKQTVEAGGGQVQLSVNGDFTAKPDVAIVVFGEEPYAEGNGDIDNLEYQRGDKRDLALLKALKAQGIPVVSVFISGRAMWVNPELNASNAFVAAWLPGSEGQGVSDVLFAKPTGEVNVPFTGKLSFSWPNTPLQSVVNVGLDGKTYSDEKPLFAYGYGLEYGQQQNLDTLSEDNLADSSELQSLALFERAVKAPWVLNIGDDSGRAAVVSSEQSQGVVSIKSMDKEVQEDARVVTYQGGKQGFVALISNFPRDLRAYSNGNASLTVQLKADEKLTQPLTLGVSCNRDCRGGVDISEQLNSALGKWQTVSVDLTCFAEQGVNFATVNTPFYLATEQAVTVSFSDLHLVPNSAESAAIVCND